MTNERIQLELLRILADASSMLFTTEQLYRDVNASVVQEITLTETRRALDKLEEQREIVRIADVDKGMLSQITAAGLARVARNSK